jgi:serine beta-lactamase-like protein LACTB
MPKPPAPSDPIIQLPPTALWPLVMAMLAVLALLYWWPRRAAARRLALGFGEALFGPRRASLNLSLLFITLMLFRSLGGYKAPDPPPGPFSKQIKQAERQIRKLIRDYPGMVMAIGWRDSIVFEGAYGYADRKGRLPMDTARQFRLYSVSKPITGVAIAQLMEDGELELSDPVTRYIPALPREYQEVSIAHLLAHTGGVRHYRPGEWMRVSRFHCDAAEQALALFRNDPLLFTPGEQHMYTTYGYVLLGMVVESISGKHFGQYVRERIFRPAGMTHTYLAGEVDTLPRLTHFYRNAHQVAAPVDNSCRGGGGGFIGTADDVARFGLALTRHELTSPAITQDIFKPLPAPEGAPQHGFGFGVGGGQHVPRYAAHAGSGLGGEAWLAVYPDLQLSVAILANRQGDDKFRAELADITRLFRDRAKALLP